MGSVVYPLSLPTVGHIKSSSFGMRRKMAHTESPFSGATQSHDYGFAKWTATITLAPMKRADAAQWCAFMVALRGRFGTFLMGDPDYTGAQGSVSSLPISVQQSQTAGIAASITENRIYFQSTATSNYTDFFKAGDYISVGSGLTRRMYMVRADAPATAGDGTAYIEPFIKTFIAYYTQLDYTTPTALFRMDSDEAIWDTDHVSKYGFTFSCTEAY